MKYSEFQKITNMVVSTIQLWREFTKKPRNFNFLRLDIENIASAIINSKNEEILNLKSYYDSLSNFISTTLKKN